MSDFDWVTARAKCSAIEMFMRLKTGVQEDIEARNRIATGTGVQYGMVGGATSFTVYQEPRGQNIAFSLNDTNTLIVMEPSGSQRD